MSILLGWVLHHPPPRSTPHQPDDSESVEYCLPANILCQNAGHGESNYGSDVASRKGYSCKTTTFQWGSPFSPNCMNRGVSYSLKWTFTWAKQTAGLIHLKFSYTNLKQSFQDSCGYQIPCPSLCQDWRGKGEDRGGGDANQEDVFTPEFSCQTSSWNI